jgi:tetraacyldisaccharide 4'-kinase
MRVPPLDGPVFAFCGIARPDQFFAGLERAGIRLAGRKPFADHYEYTNQVVEWLVQQAKFSNARALITTEKDSVRLGALSSSFPPGLPLLTADLRIEIEDAEAAIDWILKRVATPSATSVL